MNLFIKQEQTCGCQGGGGRAGLGVWTQTTIYKLDFLKKRWGGFPGGPVVKNLPANAGDMTLTWSEKISHAAGQLSLFTVTTEPMHLETVLCNQ